MAEISNRSDAGGVRPRERDAEAFPSRYSADIIFWSLTAAFAIWVVLTYRDSWYLWLDDWTLLGSRMKVLQDHGYVEFFLRRHNEHLMGGMVLWNMSLGKLFGLRSYLPWVVTVVLANICVCLIIRVYMIRLGVTRIAAAVCAPFALIWASFGSVAYWAPESIFAITAALAVSQFLLVEHEGPANRRDAVGAAAGLTAVFIHSSAAMFSPAIVGILLWRRRYRASIIASIPALAAGLWFATYGRGPQVWNFDAQPTSVPLDGPRHDLVTMVRFMGSLTSGLLVNRNSILVTFAVIVLLVYGAVVATRDGRGRFACFSIASALLIASVLTWTRAYVSAEFGLVTVGRYEALIGLLVLPLLVLASQDLARHFTRRRSWSRAILSVSAFLLVLGLQVRGRSDHNRDVLWLGIGTSETILNLADNPDLDQMDGDALVFDTPFMDLTVEDVRRLVRMGWFDVGPAP